MTPILRCPPPAPRRGPEYYWAQAKRSGDKGFTIPELHRRTRGVSYTTVKLYVHKLRDLGMVVKIGSEATDVGGTRAVRYAVAKALPTAPIRRDWAGFRDVRGRKQWQLWTAMRAMPQFFVRELAVQASTDEVEVSADMASYYVTALVKAGLVQVLTPSEALPGKVHGRTPGIYRLRPAANTGPLPLKKIGDRIFDPNTRAFVGASTDDREVSA